MAYGLQFLLLSLFLTSNALALDSLSYSGRLVNADGSPVTGTPDIQFNLSYTNAPATIICTKTITDVPLTKGVFHAKLDYTGANCTGSQTLAQVLALVPAGETIALQVTDLTNSKAYTYQAIHSIPSSIMSNIAKTLTQMGATPGQVLTWDGSKWAPSAVSGATGGTVTSVATGTGLTGGTITNSGTISIAAGGVGTTELANAGVTDAKIASGITRTKLANGTANTVVINGAGGVISEVAQLPIAQGGTGANTAPLARTALGLGTAAVANIGQVLGNVMGADAVPSCGSSQKLQMSLGPTFAWTCATDSTVDTTKLPLAGGTMAGAIDMATFTLTGLPTPIATSDAVPKSYVDSQISSSSLWTLSGSNIYRTTGNIGIGTNTPTTKLHVSGNSAKIRLDDPSLTSSVKGIDISLDSSGGSDGPTLLLERAGAGGNLYWKTSGQLIWSDGRFIMQKDLELGGSSRLIQSGDTDLIIANTGATKNILLNTNGAEAMRIDNAGRIGIGSISPAEKLDVSGNIALTGKIRLKSDNANFVELKAPASLVSTLTFNLPGTAGSSGNALITDGAGNLSWATVATGSSAVGGDLSGTISSATIVSGAVTSTKIADGTIVDADISATAAIAQSKISGLSTDLAAKEPTIAAGTSLQYWRGDKTWQTLNTAGVPELTNLYFTEARVLGTDLAGYTSGAGTISASDTVLSAIEKLNGNQLNYVLKTGDTMTGALVVPAPTLAGHATNKSYVDSLVSGSSHWNKVVNDLNYTTGNVGIGNASPAARVDIVGSGASTRKVLSVSSIGVGAGDTSPFYGGYFSTGTNNNASHVYGIYSDITYTNSSTSYAGYFSNIGNATAPSFGIYAQATQTDLNGPGTSKAAHFKVLSGLPGTSGTTYGADIENAAVFGQTAYGLNVSTQAGASTVIPFRVSHAGSEIFRINSQGNVGIGTAAPENINNWNRVLDVYAAGHSKITSSSTNVNMSINAHDTGYYGAPTGGLVGTRSNHPVSIYTNAVSRVTVSAAGNVGIGNTAPGEILDVTGNVALSGKLRMKSDTANYIELRAPTSLASTLTLTFPSTNGSSGYALTTDGAGGNLSWTAVATTASAVSGDLTGTIANSQIAAGAIVDADVSATAAIAQSKISGLTTDLAAKEPTIAAGATTQYWRGDKTWQALTTNVVPEPATGATNLYFLDSRVRAALMSGYTIGSALAIAPTDTLVEAIGKLEGSIASLQSNGQWTSASGNVYRSTGSVGISTSAPTGRLQVGAASAGLHYQIFDNNGIADYYNAETTPRWKISTDEIGSGLSAYTLSPPSVSIAAGGVAVGIAASRNLGLYTSNGTTLVERVRVNENGNVGIGVNSPGVKLAVAQGSTESTGIQLSNTGDSKRLHLEASSNEVEIRSENAPLNIHAYDGGAIMFKSLNTEYMRVNGDGNVGIGTTTPARNLHVVGSAFIDRLAGTPLLELQNRTAPANSRRVRMSIADADGVFSLEPSTDAGSTGSGLYMTPSGNIGIGTLTPGAKLEIKAGAEGQTGPVEALRIWGPNSPAGSTSAQDITYSFAAAGTSRIRAYRGGSWDTYLQFMTNPASAVSDVPLVRMHINQDGNVGIGNTAPSEKLEVTGSVLATSFLYTSDARLKKDVKKIAKALLNLEKMRGVHFTWNETNEKEMGFIAQEIEKIHPELVVTNKKTGMKSVKYGNMVALLMEAIKELKAEKDLEVKNLKREVASLKELVCLDHPNAKICKK